MSILNSTPLLMGDEGGYQISRSVRTRASASGYFNRTLSAGASQQKWTWSSWFKLGNPASGNILFQQYTDGSNQSQMRFGGGQTRFYDLQGAAFVCDITWTPVHRDPSAWYHVVFAIDTTQATNTNRIKFYVNGVQVTVTASAAWPAQNSNMRFNGNTPHFMNQNGAGSAFGDGYRTEINFVNNQQLDPTSFGEFNAITGVWQPKKYAGTYGTNGFYLNFSDNSAATAAAIGKDSSGNGNNWTPNNISVTAGVTYDSMIDTPTPYADGGNYAVLNPLDKHSGITMAEGNLKVQLYVLANGSSGYRGTVGVSSGKWYWEVLVGANQSTRPLGHIGIDQLNTSATSINTVGTGVLSTSYVYYQNNGNKINNNTSTAYGASYTTNNVIGIAFDADAGTLTFYKDGVSQGQAFSGISGTFAPSGSLYSDTINGSYIADMRYNFGQRPFSYTPPSGFKALNTQNLPASTIENGATQFNINLSAATSATRTVTGFAFAPDLVVAKNRSYVDRWGWGDSVRGANKTLASNLTNAEVATTDTIMSFNSDGFTLGADATAYGWNYNRSGNSQYAYWAWKAGGAAVTNTAGSISSQVSANTSAGFSVVTYTGTGANATVGHGLGVAPAMIINKSRNAAQDWFVFNKNLANMTNAFLKLNTTAAVATIGSAVAAPTSTTFGVSASITDTSTYVAYCFAEVAGYSKFGSYTGNGSTDGTFVYLGFRPRYIMVKASSIVADWLVYDTARDTYNVMNAELFPNTSGAEQTVSTNDFDFLSNGFKCRRGGTVSNQSGATYIYMAFAEVPFKSSLAR